MADSSVAAWAYAAAVVLMGETRNEDRTARRRHKACGTEGAITGRQGRRRDADGQAPTLPATNGLSCAGSRSGAPASEPALPGPERTQTEI